MSEKKVDICILGAGAGGLSVASVASRLGLRTVLVESHKMGGDCLNYGCVPSKSLIGAAHQAHAVRKSEAFGIKASLNKIDFEKVHDHVHRVIRTIAPHDSKERFENMGVDVIEGTAKFITPHSVSVGPHNITSKWFVVATGSEPCIPEILGMHTTPFYTNETIFMLRELPSHLVCLGGGPVGCELAQAYRRLGAEVTLITSQSILPKDDPELVDCVRREMIRDGITLYERANVKEVSSQRKYIHIRGDFGEVKASHFLVAVGRKPCISALCLERAGVAYTEQGIIVNKYLRTTNKHIFAMGDVVEGMKFTHMAEYHAGIVIRNALFRMPSAVNTTICPWVTYTSPEIAHVGMQEEEAEQKYGSKKRVLLWEFSNNDRAQTTYDSVGKIKVVVRTNGKILGASIVGRNAGELITPWTMAITHNIPLRKMSTLIVPYPTFSEVSKRVAGSFFAKTLFSPRVQRLAKILRHF